MITTSRTLPKLPTTSDASRAETTTVKMQTRVPAQTKVCGWRATPITMVPRYPIDGLMLTLFDLYGLKSPHKRYLMLLQPVKWIQSCSVSFLLESLRRDVWWFHMKEKRDAKENISWYTRQFLMIPLSLSCTFFTCLKELFKNSAWNFLSQRRMLCGLAVV